MAASKLIATRRISFPGGARNTVDLVEEGDELPAGLAPETRERLLDVGAAVEAKDAGKPDDAGDVDLSKLKKPELLKLAADHDIAVDEKDTVPELRVKVAAGLESESESDTPS